MTSEFSGILILVNILWNMLWLYDRYADSGSADSLVSLQDKLDVVKTVMKDNIQQILLNDEKLEHIDAAADKLNELSNEFQSNSKALTNKMWVPTSDRLFIFFNRYWRFAVYLIIDVYLNTYISFN